MTYPNAASGIKKIFTAEIFEIIAAIAITVAFVLGTVFLNTYDETKEAGVGEGIVGICFIIFSVAVVVFMLLSLIFKIIGFIKTARDSDAFKMIVYLTVINIGVALIASIFSYNQFVYSIAASIGEVISFICSLLAVIGITNMAANLNDVKVVTKCGIQFRLILWIGIISLALRFFAVFYFLYAFQVIITILFVISMLLSVVRYVLYLSLLASAKNMLAQK